MSLALFLCPLLVLEVPNSLFTFTECFTGKQPGTPWELIGASGSQASCLTAELQPAFKRIFKWFTCTSNFWAPPIWDRLTVGWYYLFSWKGWLIFQTHLGSIYLWKTPGTHYPDASFHVSWIGTIMLTV